MAKEKFKLTGKCKEDFDKWLLCQYPQQSQNITITILEATSKWFWSLYKPLQYTLLERFFDVAEIEIEIAKMQLAKRWYFMINDDSKLPTPYKTRNESQTEAIKQADKIYNKKHQ
jgi:hypothetical protein